MFNFILRLKRSIKRLLKVHSHRAKRLTPSRRTITLKYTLLVVFSIAIGTLYPGQSLFDPLDIPRQGEMATDDITAPFPVVLYKTDAELKDEEEEIRSDIFMILDKDTTVLTSSLRELDSFVTHLEQLRGRVRQGEGLPTTTLDSLASIFGGLSTSALVNALDIGFDLQRFNSILRQILTEDIYSPGVLASLNQLSDTRKRSVIIRQATAETVISRDKLLDMPLAHARLLTELNSHAGEARFDVEEYYLLGRIFIHPNLTLNRVEYETRVNRELESIDRVREVIQQGEVIVPARNRISERQEEILREMARMRRNTEAGTARFVTYLPALARVTLVFLILGGLFVFVRHFRRDVFWSNPKLLALLLIFAVQLGLVFAVNYAGEALNISSLYLTPLAVLPIMVAILFDAEISVLSTVALAMLLGIMERFSFPLALLTVIVGTVAAFASHTVTKRSHTFRIMFLVMLAYVMVILIVENLRVTSTEVLLADILCGVIVSVITVPLAVFLFLPLFESTFGFTTDIKLLELSDLNHPLLKRLAIEAPGTYHHSIIVSNLCEGAAKAIRGNPLLARVGAYYHDIGKIEIPEYFVENQLGIRSRHEALSPSMSALILVSHVKKGRQLGEEADIPDDVLNFIEEHHGRMLMTYFYNKAVELGADKSSEEKFRYPGPRPQTRETGICMLADAVEAASRTLDDPKPARIDNLIQKIIDDRFKSGELDECPLTLKDLAKIREAFAQSLIAAFHQRIRYPKGTQPE